MRSPFLIASAVMLANLAAGNRLRAEEVGATKPAVVTVTLENTAEFTFGRGVPILRKDDPDYPVLEAWRSAYAKEFEEGKIIRPEFTDWVRLDSPELRRVFPEFRFAGIAYKETPHPESKDASLSLAFGLRVVHAIDRQKNKIAHTLRRSDDEFSALLVAAGAKIRSLQDASDIRSAFRTLNGSTGDMTPEKVSSSLWRIPEKGYDEQREADSPLEGKHKVVITHTYWREIVADPETGTVKSWALKAETSKPRRIEAKGIESRIDRP